MSIVTCGGCGNSIDVVKRHRSHAPCPICEHPVPLPAEVPHSVMVSQIDAAVLAEREACAKIADAEADDPRGSNPGCAAAEFIAATIRARGKA